MSLRPLTESLQPFYDPGGTEVYITVEVEGREKPEVIPLNSRQAWSIVQNRLCDVLKRGFPTPHETRTALDVLSGYAYEQKRQDVKASIEHLVGQKPLAQVMILVAKKGGTQKTPKQLRAAANSVALANGINTQAGPWPRNEDALGKQLSSLAPMLARKGVVIEQGRSDERFWTIHPYSAAGDESVGEVTGGNAVLTAGYGQPYTSTPQSPPHAGRLTPERGDEVLDTELHTLLNGAMK